MIGRMIEWLEFHRTARSRIARQGKSIEYWMEQAMEAERKYDKAEPSFEVVATLPNTPSYLGEFPPMGDAPQVHGGPGL